jgi:hypothetical protein
MMKADAIVTATSFPFIARSNARVANITRHQPRRSDTQSNILRKEKNVATSSKIVPKSE